MTETTFEEEPGLVQVLPGRPGHGSTHRVVWVSPGCCTYQSFNKPESAQPPDGPGLGSTRRIRPGLITMYKLV
jgi:hypothetical protein